MARTNRNATLLIAVLACALIAALSLHFRANNSPDTQAAQTHLERTKQVMGMEMHLCLLDWATYRNKILPAERAFAEHGDAKPLVQLLSQSIAKSDRGHPASANPWPPEVYQEFIDILTGKISYGFGGFSAANPPKKEDLVRFAKSQVVPAIVETLGLVRNHASVNPLQNMGRDPINPYLRDRSVWMEEFLTFARTVHGEALEFPVGESTELFTAADLKDFQAAFNKVPRPQDPALQQQFDNIAALLKIASTDPSSALAIVVL